MAKKEVFTVQYQKLCIFTVHGKTFSFSGVIVLTDNETCLVFTYSAMSDGLAKQGTFWKNTMSGYSVTPA